MSADWLPAPTKTPPMTHPRGSCGIALAPCPDCEPFPFSDDIVVLQGQCRQLAAMYAQVYQSRDQFMAEAAKLAVRCNNLETQNQELRADLHHALRQSRLTAEALVLANERVEGGIAEAERLTEQVEAMRDENHELQCRVWELEGEGA